MIKSSTQRVESRSMLYRCMDGSEDDLELLNKHDDEEEHRILKGCFPTLSLSIGLVSVMTNTRSGGSPAPWRA